MLDEKFEVVSHEMPSITVGHIAMIRLTLNAMKMHWKRQGCDKETIQEREDALLLKLLNELIKDVDLKKDEG